MYTIIEIITNALTLVGVLCTIIFSRIDNKKAIKAAKLDNIQSIKAARKDNEKSIQQAEKNSKEILYASVKPIIYATKYAFCDDDFKNVACVFKTKTDDSNLSNFEKSESNIVVNIKNTNNGIAIVEKILIKNIPYKSTHTCIIDKGESVDIGIQINSDFKPFDFKICVSDIYNNTYTYPCNIEGNGNFNIMNDSKSEENNPNITNPTVTTGDVTTNSGIVGQTNAPTTINNSNSSSSTHENDILDIYRKADGQTQMKIMNFIYKLK